MSRVHSSTHLGHLRFRWISYPANRHTRLRSGREKSSGLCRVSSYFYLGTVTPNQGDMMTKRNTRKSARPTAPDASQPAFDRVSNREIAVRAYEIYLARGAMSGNDLGDWLQAERELGYQNSQG